MTASRTSHLEVRQGENAATPHLAPHLVRGAGCGETSRTSEGEKVRSSSSLQSTVDIRTTIPAPCSALASHCDQQSLSLLAHGSITIVLTHLFVAKAIRCWCWECHGKITGPLALLSAPSDRSRSLELGRYPRPPDHLRGGRTGGGASSGRPPHNRPSRSPHGGARQTRVRCWQCPAPPSFASHDYCEGRMTKREKITIELPPGVRDMLARWAAEEGRSLSNLVRRLVMNGIDQHRCAGGEDAGERR
jgi:hypothetical protein